MQPPPEEEEISENPSINANQKSAFVQFLTQIGSFSGDLSLLTAPSFLLNGSSMLEYSTHWNDFPDILAECHYYPSDDPQAPLERMKRVARYFLSTLYGSYHERCSNGSEKKPFNPVLGEQLYCYWEAKDEAWTRADMIVEQVSHHPPIGAFHVHIDDKVSVEGFCAQKSKIAAMSIKVNQIGHATLVLYNGNRTETYVISPLPDLQIRGLLSGSIFLELVGSTQITCEETKLTCKLDWLPKPWFSGEYHNVDGKIYSTQSSTLSLKSENIKAKISGRWVDQLNIQTGSGDVEPFFNFYTHYGQDIRDPNNKKKLVGVARKYPIKEQPLSLQNPEKDSKKIWETTTAAILKGDYSTASTEKNRLEEQQRKMRKDREASGDVWEPEWFRYVPGLSTQKLEKHSRARSKDSVASKSSQVQHHDGSDGGTWTFKEDLLPKLRK